MTYYKGWSFDMLGDIISTASINIVLDNAISIFDNHVIWLRYLPTKIQSKIDFFVSFIRREWPHQTSFLFFLMTST